MASTGTGLSFFITTARFAYSAGSTPTGSTLATSMTVRWLRIRCAVSPNQKLLIWHSISPLPGIGSGRTTSERGQAVGGDDEQVAVAEVEHVADLAAMAQGQAGEVGFEQGGRHAHSVRCGAARGTPPGGRWRPCAPCSPRSPKTR